MHCFFAQATLYVFVKTADALIQSNVCSGEAYNNAYRILQVLIHIKLLISSEYLML